MDPEKESKKESEKDVQSSTTSQGDDAKSPEDKEALTEEELAKVAGGLQWLEIKGASFP